MYRESNITPADVLKQLMIIKREQERVKSIRSLFVMNKPKPRKKDSDK
jgi:hypothetical protein